MWFSPKGKALLCTAGNIYPRREMDFIDLFCFETGERKHSNTLYDVAGKISAETDAG
jgi:hypothetical protein